MRAEDLKVGQKFKRGRSKTVYKVTGRVHCVGGEVYFSVEGKPEPLWMSAATAVTLVKG